MPDPRRSFGNKGEALAASFLERKGLRVLDAQASSRGGEIDLVCLDGDTVVFVEVKTRRGSRYGYPEAAVTLAKIRRILRTAHQYLTQRQWEARAWRVDVVAIRAADGEPPEIIHFENIDIPEGLW